MVAEAEGYNINAKCIFVLSGVMHNFNLQKHRNKIDKLDKENVQIVRKKAKCGEALAVVAVEASEVSQSKSNYFWGQNVKKEKEKKEWLG